MAAWAPLIPFAKARTGVDDGGLGLLLLCLGIGSILAMPAAGALAQRLGCRSVILLVTALVCLSLPALATAASAPALAIALLVFGAGLGSLDVVMNVQAIVVERASGRPMMSGFHGWFSIGGVCGPVVVTALLGLGASPLATTLAVVACLIGCLIAAQPHLLRANPREVGQRGGSAFAWPRGIVLAIGLLCSAVFLMEGAVLDWSALFLTSIRGLPGSYGGLGYAAFAVTMTLGRLTGDRLVHRLGGRRVLRFGGGCAAAGIGLVVLVPAWPASLLGFALVGAGCSNIVPVLFSSVGRQRVMPESVAVPAITTLGYAGILLGPAAIGGIAHLTSLPAAFGLLAVMMVAVAASARLLRDPA